jgi:hypothetical protein
MTTTKVELGENCHLIGDGAVDSGCKVLGVPHSHHINDSITVCCECGINLKLIHSLQENNLIEWWQLRLAIKDGRLHTLGGVGEVSVRKLRAVRIRQ